MRMRRRNDTFGLPEQSHVDAFVARNWLCFMS